MNSTVIKVTERIRRRSAASRDANLARIRQAAEDGPNRTALSCSNLAHGMAGCGQSEKQGLSADRVANIGIVSAYVEICRESNPVCRDYEAGNRGGSTRRMRMKDNA